MKTPRAFHFIGPLILAVLMAACSGNRDIYGKAPLKIVVDTSPKSPEVRAALQELRSRLEVGRPAIVLSDGEMAGRVAFAYYVAGWKNSERDPEISVVDCGDAWLVTIGRIPKGAVGGLAYLLVSKSDGSLLGTLQEE